MKNNRRDFFKLAGGTVAAYTLPSNLLAEDEFNEYKALVIVNLLGGNDSLNMFIPSDENGYKQYSDNRAEILRVKNVDLTPKLSPTNNPLNLQKGSGNPYYTEGSLSKAYLNGFYKHSHSPFDGNIATNALMPEIAHLMNQGKGAILYNTGNITQKATKAQLRSGEAKIPTSYASHLDAGKYLASGRAGSLTFATGWLGGLGDTWKGINGSSIYKLTSNLSRLGQEKVLFGYTESSLTVPLSGPRPFRGDTPRDEGYTNASLNLERRDIFKKLFNQKRKSALTEIKSTFSDWVSVSGENIPYQGINNAYGEKLFTKTSQIDLGIDKPAYSAYIPYFEAASKMISIGKKKGLKRQVIYITLVAWDTHTNASELHARNLRGLSMGVGDFQKSMDAMGLSQNVTLASVSEFSRTTSINKTGTDHGWGGSHFIIGGAVKSGTYGTFPDLNIGGDDDISSRGRIIPTTSFSQYYATLLNWFGAKENEINAILPELKNFSQKNLGFFK